jgi:arginyl-tRNA synthetase
MSIEAILQTHIAKALQSLYSADAEANILKMETTKPDFVGDYTFVVFPFLRVSKKKPEETAAEIGEYLKVNCNEVENYNVIKGFLNLEITNSYWVNTFVNDISTAENFGKTQVGKGQKVMVEYSSPNTNKPLHLGHVRNNLLGYSVSQILEHNGYEVVKANLINDRGIHICKSMIAWQKFGNGETPETSGLKGDHLVGKYYVEFDKHYKEEIKQLVAQGKTEDEAKKEAPLLIEAQEMLRQWEAGDDEVISLWKTMNQWVYSGFEATYNRMGVSFNQYYYESNTYLLGKDIVNEGLEKGVFFKKDDSSVWIDLQKEKLDEKLLLRKDGTSVYMTQDIGTADKKFEEYGCDKSVYVVGNEQDYHFKVLFAILKKLGKSYADGLYHLSYGMVDLPEGKMKSREGTVVDADDLMDEMHNTAKELSQELGKIEGLSDEQQHQLFETLGMGALKYFLLRVDPNKRLLFDPKESIDFAGNTGPFIQYVHARICSLLKNITDSGFTTNNQTPTEISESERDLIIGLSKFPKAVEEAGLNYNPATIAAYIYDLAKLYNRFYRDMPVNKETDETLKSFRVKLTATTGKVLKQGLTLLGITAPERM